MSVANTLPHERLHQVAAAYGHCRLVDDHAKARAVHRRADAARGSLKVTQVRCSVWQGRSANRNEDYVAFPCGVSQFAGELDSSAPRGQSDDLFQVRLINRGLATLPSRDLVLVAVDAGDVM